MDRIKLRTILQISNIIAYFIMIILNVLSGAGLLNGRTVGEISDNYQNLFTPAGLTFSIWSVIYFFLLLFILYQAKDVLKSQKDEIPYIEQINIFFIISCALNGLWIVVWVYNLILLSLIIMIFLLVDLIIIYLRLNIALEEKSIKDKIIFWIPFSLYLGWISIATIANTTAFLISINWDGFGVSPLIWTYLILIIALLLTLIVLYSRKDFVYPLVTVWALFGIIIKQINQNYEIALFSLIINLILIFNLIIYYILLKKILKKDKL